MDWGSILSNTAAYLISPETIAYALAALGLAVHFGYTGLLNFGQAGFMAIGAYGYAISILSFDLPWWVGIIIGMAASVVFAFILGIPTLRLRADYLAIVTIASAEIVRLLFTTQAFDEYTTRLTASATTTRDSARPTRSRSKATWASARGSTTPTAGGCVSSVSHS